jgi:cyanophycin synthetase
VVGLRFAGIDVIAPEAARSLAEGGVVLEVNCTPGIHHHYAVADPDAASRVAVPVLEHLLA